MPLSTPGTHQWDWLALGGGGARHARRCVPPCPRKGTQGQRYDYPPSPWTCGGAGHPPLCWFRIGGGDPRLHRNGPINYKEAVSVCTLAPTPAPRRVTNPRRHPPSRGLPPNLGRAPRAPARGAGPHRQRGASDPVPGVAPGLPPAAPPAAPLWRCFCRHHRRAAGLAGAAPPLFPLTVFATRRRAGDAAPDVGGGAAATPRGR